jgi:hypothetical protein
MRNPSRVVGLAALVGLLVGNATYAIARGEEPLNQAVATGVAAFVVMVVFYVLRHER